MSLEWSGARIVALLILLAVSGFASSSETALFSLNRFQLRRIRDRYKKAFQRIAGLLSQPGRLLLLILLVNEVVNISITSLVTEMLHANRGPLASLWPSAGGSLSPRQEWLLTSVLSLAVSVPLLLVFGEVTPKIFAAKANKLVAIANTRILAPLHAALKPLLKLIDAGVSFFLPRLKASGKDPLSKTMSAVSEEEFLLLMEEGHREGTVNLDERRLITNVLEFDDSTVADVMTPIPEAFCVPDDAKLWDILPEIRAQKYSRVAVYHKTRRNIVGILYVKSLLKLQTQPELRQKPVKELMAPAIHVKPDMHLSSLFKRFKASKTHIAICADRNGNAIGLVTMEDVLESIFGEIEDERDVQ